MISLSFTTTIIKGNSRLVIQMLVEEYIKVNFWELMRIFWRPTDPHNKMLQFILILTYLHEIQNFIYSTANYKLFSPLSEGLQLNYLRMRTLTFTAGLNCFLRKIIIHCNRALTLYVNWAGCRILKFSSPS
jgi:hypothetical protein